jgi:hypothetical protein
MWGLTSSSKRGASDAFAGGCLNARSRVRVLNVVLSFEEEAEAADRGSKPMLLEINSMSRQEYVAVA